MLRRFPYAPYKESRFRLTNTRLCGGQAVQPTYHNMIIRPAEAMTDGSICFQCDHVEQLWLIDTSTSWKSQSFMMEKNSFCIIGHPCGSSTSRIEATLPVFRQGELFNFSDFMKIFFR